MNFIFRISKVILVCILLVNTSCSNLSKANIEHPFGFGSTPKEHLDWLHSKKIQHQIDQYGNPHTKGELLVKFQEDFDHIKLQLVKSELALINGISKDSIEEKHCSCAEEDVVLLSYDHTIIGNLEPATGSMGDQDGDDDGLSPAAIKGITTSHNYYHAPLPHHLNALAEHPHGFEIPDTSIGRLHHKPNENRLIVAILDSGLDFDHPEFPEIENFALWQAPENNCYILGYDFVNNRSYAIDDHGHGTQVTGVILKELESYNAPIDIMPLKISNEHGAVKLFDLYCAMNFAVNHGAKIINISSGWYGTPNSIIYEVIENNPEVLFVCSAGNSGINTDKEGNNHYPSGFSNLPNLISVAATNKSKDALAAFSNYGEQTIDIAAPGESIRTLTPCDGQDCEHPTTIVDGTSFSAPYVTASAILLATCKTSISNELTAGLMKSEIYSMAKEQKFIKERLATNSVMDMKNLGFSINCKK